MLQQPNPGDYVVATKESHTVREFANLPSQELIWITVTSLQPTSDSIAKQRLTF
jgi:GDP-D-mannose dehydratase